MGFLFGGWLRWLGNGFMETKGTITEEVKTTTAVETPKPDAPVAPVAERLPAWLKLVLVILPAGAFLVSMASLGVSFWSLRYSMGYARPHEDHDLVARVLGVSALTKGFSSINTNGELTVDVAVINRGNQKEIVREAFLCYSDTNNFAVRGRTWFRTETLNVQLDKWEKRVFHLSNSFNPENTGKRMWLGVAVRAVAPNADDLEVSWPVCEINLAPDGNGSWVSYNKDKTPQIEIISNVRMPHQRISPDGF
jgi:hypothetical protein